MMSLLLTGKLLNQGFLVLRLRSSVRQLYGPHHDLVNRYGVSVTNDNGYVPFVVITIRFFLQSWRSIGFVRIVMPHVEQELPTLPEHLMLSPDLSGVRVARSSVFCVMFCRSLFVILSFFLWSLCYLPFFDLRLLITPLVFQIFFFPVYSNILFVSLMTDGIDLELVFTNSSSSISVRKLIKRFRTSGFQIQGFQNLSICSLRHT